MEGVVCNGGYCNKCKGGMLLVAGILVLVNYFWAKFDWWVFVGAILVLKGLSKMAMPMCSCCKDQMMKEKRKK